MTVMKPIETAKQQAVSGMEFFLRNFAHVPEDRLNWSPVPTAKSALRIAAHVALYAGRFASMIRERQVPKPVNLVEWLADRDAEEIAIKSREEVEQVYKLGTAEVLRALDDLNENDLESTIDSGQGWSMPFSHLINLPGWHATLHAGQIDYLQTCWDDQTVYVD